MMRTTDDHHTATIRRLALASCVAAFGLLLVAPGSALASDVFLNENELGIDGDPDSDTIVVSTDGTTITVTDTGTGGATAGTDCAQVTPTRVTCPAVVPDGRVNDYEVDPDDGVDSFTNQNLPVIEGHVHANGTTGSKTLIGGPGDELLQGGNDDDVIDGGEGNDELDDGGGEFELADGAGNDLLVGGAGEDFVRYFRGEVAVTITLDGLANDGQAGEADNVQVENVSSGEGNDVLVGDGSPNQLTAGGGSDLVRGLAGNDDLVGDGFTGAMLARGGPPIVGGDDTLDGGSGRDGLDCGPGFDLALREPGDDLDGSCERIGAEVVGDSAAVSKKNKFKVQIECPATEVKACSGKLKITSGGKKAGKGKFSVAAGKTKGGKAKLSKKGAKKLRKGGGTLLVTVIAKTDEPGGVSEDRDTVFLHR